MIGIVDYGRGNLRSVEKALAKLNFPAKIMTEPEELKAVQGIILPGVGAFADAMAALKEKSWIEPLRQYAASGRPFRNLSGHASAFCDWRRAWRTSRFSPFTRSSRAFF